MTVKLTCPVCDRPDIDGNICPNCEADLTPIRQLQELSEVAVQPAPIPQPERVQNFPKLIVAIAIIMLLLGLALGASVRTQLATRPAPVEPEKIVRSSPFIPILNKSKLDKKNRPPCGGFYYSVQRGDSLVRIAQKFYGGTILRTPSPLKTGEPLNGRPMGRV
jgi:hypothetical protein